MKPANTFRRTVTKLPPPPPLQTNNTQVTPHRPLLAPQHIVDWDSLPVSSALPPSDDPLLHQPISQPTSSIPITSEREPVHPRPSGDDLFSRPTNRRRIWESDDTLPPSSLPEPTPPSSSTAVTVNNTQSQALNSSQIPKPSNPTSILSSKEQFLSSLQDSLDIYDMPKAELEILIANIVREDQFAKLVSVFG